MDIDPERIEQIERLLKELRELTESPADVVDVLTEAPAMELVLVGEVLVAYLLRKSELTLDIHHLAILEKITGINPVPEANQGDLPSMREFWYAWGHDNGH
jgi:hypothetical protein